MPYCLLATCIAKAHPAMLCWPAVLHIGWQKRLRCNSPAAPAQHKAGRLQGGRLPLAWQAPLSFAVPGHVLGAIPCRVNQARYSPFHLSTA